MLTTDKNLQEGRYRIVNRRAQNAARAVYQAYDNVLEANVILEETFVDLGKVATAAQIERRKSAFADEAMKLKAINHESLARVCDYFSEFDRQYLVTEYVDGNNLSELIEKNKSPVPLSKAMAWADHLLDALGHLHAHLPPIFHGKIKPEKIKLTSGGAIKLLGFNISNQPGGKTNFLGANQNFEAAAIHYLPLECIWSGLDSATRRVITNNYDEKSVKILEQPADARSDIYALGATLYYALTARRPIDALERSIDILEGKNDPLPAPSEINKKVPSEISDALMKALEIKRENRFDSTAIMRQVLRTALVRAKEREAEETENRTEAIYNASEARLSEENINLTENAPIELEIPEIEPEQERQAEARRQHEEQLLKAEQRAAELQQRITDLENRLSEKEIVEPNIEESSESKIALVATASEAFSAQISNPAEISFGKITENNFSKSLPNEHGTLFSDEPYSPNRWQKPAIALALLLIIGGASGFWYWQTTGKAESGQTITEPPPSVPATKDDIETRVETAPPSLNVEIKSEADTPIPFASPDATEISDTQTTPRNKPAPTRAEKRNTPPVKTAPKKTKTVTVDDIINDN